MNRFIINGQNPLNGIFTPSGNKNAALPMLAACLLTDEPVTLSNVPDILDVRVMLELLAHLGVEVSQTKKSVTLCAKGLQTTRLDPELCRKVRSSILLAGPLAARHGTAELFSPGGDVIGRRRVDTHFLALQALGVTLKTNPHSYRLAAKKLRAADILLDEASVTATENVLMAACLARGTTTLFNTACEPHVSDLATLLNKMGAHIEGIGTNRLVLRGVTRLHGATHRIGPDYIEIGSILAAAAVTGGSVSIPLTSEKTWLPILAQSFAKLGVELKTQDRLLRIEPIKTLRIRKDLTFDVPKIEDGPWPTFPSDLMSVAIVLATQAQGTTLFFEKMFESRLYFVDSLISMGAQIIQCDPHRVIVAGPSKLHPAHLNSPDIRAGMALLIAALCAKGKSTIENARMIDRGYERIDERLRALGADITRE